MGNNRVKVLQLWLVGQHLALGTVDISLTDHSFARYIQHTHYCQLALLHDINVVEALHWFGSEALNNHQKSYPPSLFKN
jgi:hypothetical protein